mgnify:CR=1 FL=1
MITAIIPAYNESACIHDVMASWMQVLYSIDHEYTIIVIDDGSTDDTYDIISSMKDDHLKAVKNHNAGHGATIYDGYIKALQTGDGYVFQTDSDGQTNPEDFRKAWELSKKHPNSVIIGYRKHRQDGIFRKISTKTLRLAIYALTGEWITDANAPFRIMPSSILRSSLERIPKRPGFTNILLSIVMKKHADMIFTEIEFGSRKSGKNSVNIGNMFGKSIQAIHEITSLKKSGI